MELASLLFTTGQDASKKVSIENLEMSVWQWAGFRAKRMSNSILDYQTPAEPVAGW